MRNSLGTCLRTALAAALCAGAAFSAEGRREGRPIRFLNRLRPGQEIRYDVFEQQVVRTQRRGRGERFVWERDGSWTLYFTAGDEDHAPQVAHQLLLSAGRMKDYQRSGVRADQPGADLLQARLPSPACQLLIRSVDATAVPMVLPTAQGFDGVLYRLALDHLSWPDEPMTIDEPFRDPLEWDGFSGERIRRPIQVERTERGREATVALAIQGDFSGRAAGRGRLESAGSLLRWDLSNQMLNGLVSEVVYSQKKGLTRVATSLRFTVERRSSRRLGAAQRKTARAELIELTNLIGLLRQGESDALVKRVEAFGKRYAGSAWLPTAEYLAEQATTGQENAGPLGPQALAEALSSVMIRWQAAGRLNDHLRGELAWKSFEELNRRNHRDLLRLAQAEDVDLRSMAVFALGFGAAPADLVTIERSARHEHARVRSWAAYALAIRGDAGVSPDLLSDLLADSDVRVRVRACQAAAACLPGSEADTERFRKRLLALLADADPAVRLAAAEALGDIGTPDDAPAVQEIMTAEQNPEVLEALSRTLQALTR